MKIVSTSTIHNKFNSSYTRFTNSHMRWPEDWVPTLSGSRRYRPHTSGTDGRKIWGNNRASSRVAVGDWPETIGGPGSTGCDSHVIDMQLQWKHQP